MAGADAAILLVLPADSFNDTKCLNVHVQSKASSSVSLQATLFVYGRSLGQLCWSKDRILGI